LDLAVLPEDKKKKKRPQEGTLGRSSGPEIDSKRKAAKLTGRGGKKKGQNKTGALHKKLKKTVERKGSKLRIRSISGKNGKRCQEGGGQGPRPTFRERKEEKRATAGRGQKRRIRGKLGPNP